MKRFTDIFLVVDLKSLFIIALAVASTWASLQLNLIAEFELALIGTAIVFPIVFSIGQAYKRREDALTQYGSLKAHGRAMYFGARDWLPNDRGARVDALEAVLLELFSTCRDMFKRPLKETEAEERKVYAAFSHLSEFVKTLRADGLNSSECSRANQYISKMLVSFENIKHIYQYRTPRSLQAFSDVFIILFAVVYGPYFAYLAKSFSPQLTYVMPVLFALVLTALANIQKHLENPFDQIGQDDVMINAEKFVSLLDCGEAAAPPIAKAA